MDNNQTTESTIPAQSPKQTLTPKTGNTAKNILFIIIVIALILGSFFVGSYYNQTRPLSTATTTTETANEPTESVTLATNATNTATPKEEWKTAKYGGLFSYEYPAGWHVAELWQENTAESGVILAIDPNPISTAPRGGPLATFQIQVLNGNKNPDEILTKKMQDFNTDNYTDITKQTIDAPIGKIYHFKGKFPLDGMMGGEKIETYYFTFNQNPSDPYNQQVVIASLLFDNNPEYSEMLRHIVLSVKKLTP